MKSHMRFINLPSASDPLGVANPTPPNSLSNKPGRSGSEGLGSERRCTVNILRSHLFATKRTGHCVDKIACSSLHLPSFSKSGSGSPPLPPPPSQYRKDGGPTEVHNSKSHTTRLS
eukprot:CAMPEP_0178421034 /NCGR_PEP_ID=MMETSP0689_2-20121128/26442_1 /TAXON_ID=160604 /ORGANISM="Amphidinium massartii, Strain CS-259" /LENGTH=115 /DNA_ID=CAMNT_0020042539 /DNA_START=178 /DNA_END=525 /DNA_ORIENTATION=-